jgi:predicted membrane channel-forming protein YqfA (hemolysin III family)
MTKESGNGQRWILAVAVVAVLAMLFVPPIPQDPNYHLFADTRALAGIPNFWNVVSNVPFAFAGLYGLLRTPRLSSTQLRAGYVIFCIAVIGVCFGSSYYHWAPSTATLVWDRLPMSVAFMALFALILGDRVSAALGRALLLPLLLIGAGSVFYWAWTEGHGAGDLRPYALVQFLPMVLIVLMLLLCPGSPRSVPWLWASFILYGLAKVTEYFDAPIYQAIGLSGHSIKHLLSALAVLVAIFALLQLRAPQPQGSAAAPAAS